MTVLDAVADDDNAICDIPRDVLVEDDRIKAKGAPEKTKICLG